MTKTTHEIIDETVEVYSDTSKRAAIGVACFFFHKPTGNMCAVGRCLSDPKNFKVSDSGYPVHSTQEHLDSGLKPEYRGHSPLFWDYLQRLHDTGDYWDEGVGLSDDGKRFVRLLKGRFPCPN